MKLNILIHYLILFFIRIPKLIQHHYKIKFNNTSTNDLSFHEYTIHHNNCFEVYNNSRYTYVDILNVILNHQIQSYPQFDLLLNTRFVQCNQRII